MRLSSAALFFLTSALACGANIVLNPGFELGPVVAQGQPILNWNSHTTAGTFGFGVGNANPHSGSQAAVTGCTGSGCLNSTTGTWIAQTLPTSPGSTYTLTFWYDSRAQGSGPSTGGNFTEFDVYWDGAQILTLPNVAPGYTQYTVNGLLASTSATVLQFNGRNDPNLGWLDDVDVELAASSVPEPATYLLSAVGLALLGIGRLRRRLS